MNGHDHGDNLSIIDNIPFYTVNSASYVWLGTQIMDSKRLTQCYGCLNGKLPYKQALCVLVEIDETEIRIRGISHNIKYGKMSVTIPPANFCF